MTRATRTERLLITLDVLRRAIGYATVAADVEPVLACRTLIQVMERVTPDLRRLSS